MLNFRRQNLKKKCCSKSLIEQNTRHKMQNTKYEIPDTHCRRAFTLIEMVTALIILALISSSVLVVINRCVASAADSALRMKAFEVARENMEKLLTADSVKQTTDFGTSDKYPEI